MRRIFILSVIMAMVLGFSLQAHAALSVRGTDNAGNRLIYDSDLDITWYDYSKSAGTYEYWADQNQWASDLSVNFGGTIYNDWRLPATFNQDCQGYNCTNSEMGHLFYTELGNKAYDEPGWGLNNTGDFQNLLATGYWSTADANWPEFAAWMFYTDVGYQSDSDVNENHYALAVRTGDVPVVPEPISTILFLTGGAVLAGRNYIKRMKKA